MGIGAADPKRAHARSPRTVPVAQLAVDEKRAGCEVERGFGFAKVESRWNLAMFDRQHGLDETCYSGGRVEVADVGLHRSKRAIAAPIGDGTEGLCQRRHLDRISERGTSAMSLDIANLVSVDAGHRECPGDHLGLAVHARSGISDLPRAVVVDSRSGDDRVHAVA